MAVNGTPNSVYTLQALMAELKTISRANGYSTDVRTVKMPDYAPDDADWQTMMAEEAPALLMWLWDEVDTGRENTGEDRPTLRIFMLGVVKQHQGLQEGILGLASDVRRVMRANPVRNYPELETTNIWAVNTKPGGSKTFDYFYETGKTATTAKFASWWDIEYRFPRTTG